MSKAHLIAIALIGFLLAPIQPAQAQEAGQERERELVERGQKLAVKYCSRCHAIGSEGKSPFAEAPPFSNIARRWNPEVLAEAFAEGIVVGHPDMPEFMFEPEQIGELIEYLKALSET